MGVVGSLQYYIALLLGLAALAMEVFALIDALRHRSEAFTAAGKLTKQIWTIILVVAVAIGFVTAQNPSASASCRWSPPRCTSPTSGPPCGGSAAAGPSGNGSYGSW